ncbi:MoaD/ThiS family protein [bacterium]|nr:MAG: MoaD/ThiS family protein [bacterium]
MGGDRRGHGERASGGARDGTAENRDQRRRRCGRSHRTVRIRQCAGRREVGVNVRIVAYARARELLGAAELQLEIPGSATLAQLRQHLQHQAPRLGELGASLRFARNGTLAGEDEILREDDEVALLPPVSGG